MIGSKDKFITFDEFCNFINQQFEIDKKQVIIFLL